MWWLVILTILILVYVPPVRYGLFAVFNIGFRLAWLVVISAIIITILRTLTL